LGRDAGGQGKAWLSAAAWHTSRKQSSFRNGSMRARGAEAAMTEFSDPPERFLKLDEVSRRVGLGKSMIYALIKQERFPPPYKISPYASRWSEHEVAAWILKVKGGVEGKRRQMW
jgi:prophage regulatory protein